MKSDQPIVSRRLKAFTGGRLNSSDRDGLLGLKLLLERRGATVTLVDADTIDYRFTVTDPATFTRPWTAATPMNRIKEPIFEYACHEGNYAVANMLRGARAQDQAGALKKSGPQ